MQTIVFLYVTMPSGETAQEIGRVILEEQLAGCINILPAMHSMYWWNGAIQTDNEAVMVVKTTPQLVPRLEKRILELHPYDTPCIAVFPADHINTAYADWLITSVKKE